MAIANAKLTYKRYQEIYDNARWRALAKKGAQTQRLLWASTSTKNPNYKDTIYVEELIGADTVNTLPPNTLEAFRNHGTLKSGLTENLDEARATMRALDDVGISMKAVTDKLLVEGVELFADAFRKLLAAVEKERQQSASKLIDRLSYKLPAELENEVKKTITAWQQENKMSRLWSKDSSLWTGSDEFQMDGLAESQ